MEKTEEKEKITIQILNNSSKFVLKTMSKIQQMIEGTKDCNNNIM